MRKSMHKSMTKIISSPSSSTGVKTGLALVLRPQLVQPSQQHIAL
jgi:hypothetical protein